MDFRKFSNRQTWLWSFFALCLGTVSCEVFYKQEGSTIKIQCTLHTSGLITWRYGSDMILNMNLKNGQSFKGIAPMVGRVNARGRSIEIKDLKNTDNGRYTCAVEGTNPEEHLLYIIQISVKPPAPLLASSKAELECQIVGGSKAKKTWVHPIGDSYITSEAGSAILSNVKLSDSGTWTCLIEENGKTFKQEKYICVLDLSTSNLTVSEGESVLLQCDLSFCPTSPSIQAGSWSHLNPVPQTLLSLQSGTDELKWQSDAAVKNMKFTAENLHRNFSLTLKNVKAKQAGDYECSLTFSGDRIIKRRLNVVVDQLPRTSITESKTKGSLSINEPWLRLDLWVWIAVGAGSIVLIILIITAVLLNQRNKRKKRRIRKQMLARKLLASRDYCQCNRGEESARGSQKERKSTARPQ